MIHLNSDRIIGDKVAELGKATAHSGAIADIYRRKNLLHENG